MSVGDITPTATYAALREDPLAQLVDVRTEAEWAYVGLPDLGAAGKEPVLIPWQIFPAMEVNGGFVDALRRAGFSPANRLHFICRSGVRSLAAAQAAQAAGFAQVFNVAGGFEGPIGPDGHRGMVAGWKAEGLPWRQR